MQDHDIKLPPIHDSANDAAAKAQAHYFTLLGVEIVSLIVAAILTVLATSSDLAPVTAAIAAASFLAGLIGMIANRQLAFEREWFLTRAVAESVKSLAWRCAMKAAPFEDESPVLRYSERLERIASQYREVSASIVTAIGSQLPESILAARVLPVKERALLYERKRLQPQILWYSTSATSKKANDRRWFAAFILVQVLCGVALYVQSQNPSATRWSAVGACTAAGILTWMRAKRFSDLSTSYGVAAIELSAIATRLKTLSAEGDFATFVDDTEELISREHTSWLAKVR